jgi:hypothetical protein
MDQERSMYTPEFFMAWEKMTGSVENAFRYVGDGSEQNRPIALHQTRYVLASLAMAQLFKDLEQQELAAQFHFLAEAMQDLVDGIAHPLFKVEAPSRPGRQPDTSVVWRIRSSVCIGIEFLIAGGMKDDEAVQFVAKKHKKALTKILRPNAELKSSLKTWLKSFANDEVRNDVALASYKEGIARLTGLRSKYTGEQIRSAGENLVASAAERALSWAGF